MNSLIKTLAGTIFLLLYCLCTALSSVLIGATEQGLTLGVTMFYSFFISMVFCNVINITRFKHYLPTLKQLKRPIIILNITTTVVWIGMFYALLFVSPAIVTSLYLGAIPIATFLLQRKNIVNSIEKRSTKIFVALIALILLALIIDDLQQVTDWSHAIIGMVVCIACAMAGAVSNIKAREIGMQKIPTSMVMAVRLYVIVIVAALLLPFDRGHLLLNGHVLWQVTVIAALSLVVPLFLLQKGLERIDALYVSILMPFIPVMTFFMQLFSPLYHFSWLEFILIVLLAMVIGVSAVVKIRLSKV
jgi:drug/metabolite transporter (DMT)-like permease